MDTKTKKQVRPFQEVTKDEYLDAYRKFSEYLAANIDGEAESLLSTVSLFHSLSKGATDPKLRREVNRFRREFAEKIDSQANSTRAQIRKELQDLTEAESKDVLAVIRFLAWRKSGREKTEETERGEGLYFWKKSHDQTAVAE